MEKKEGERKKSGWEFPSWERQTRDSLIDLPGANSAAKHRFSRPLLEMKAFPQPRFAATNTALLPLFLTVKTGVVLGDDLIAWPQTDNLGQI